MMNTTEGILYTSNSYRVEANSAGVEVTNMHTGYTEWFEGEAATDVRDALAIIPARVPNAKVTKATDAYLSTLEGKGRK